MACDVADPPEAAATEDLALLVCTRAWVRDPDADPDPPVVVDALARAWDTVRDVVSRHDMMTRRPPTSTADSCLARDPA